MNTLDRRSIPLFWVVAVLLAGSAILPGKAEAQGLTYTIVPSARWIDWDEDLDFDRSRLLGGALNIGFGRYVGLTAFYHQDDAATLFTDSVAGDFDTELVQTGGEITLAFGTGTLVPVIKGGASIIRFRPEDDAFEDFTKLSFDYGGGLRAVFSETISAEVMVESSEFRFASERVRGGTVPTEEAIRQNLSLRAGLGIQLGSRTFDRASEMDDAFASTYDSPFDNFGLAIEPLFGRFTFDDDLAIADQDAWGLRAGFDFGSFFGLRGFYWGGTEEDDVAEFTDFRAYGGEAQFNLGAGPGINPYLLAGVTRFDWDSDLPEALRIDGRNAVTLGAGVDLAIGERFRLTASARDNILAASDLGGDLIEEVSDPNDLIHNWQFSAGLSFVLGQGSDRGERRTQSTDAREAQAAVEADESETATPMTAQDAEGEPTTSRNQPTEVETTSDTIEVRMPGEAETRTIVLPVLENGEIYIRFGGSGASPFLQNRVDSAGVAQGDLRAIIREEMESMSTGGMSSEALMQELRALEARLQTRLDGMAGGTGGADQPAVVVERAPEPSEPGVSRESRELRPYSGLAVSGGTQLLFGVATDLGPLNSGSAFNIVPQFALGLGEGKPSYLLNASLEYRFSEFGVTDMIQLTPMFSAGPSLVRQDGTDLRLTTFLGTGVRLLDDGGAETLDLFAGYQGVDFFSDGRLLVGLRLGR